MENSPVEGFLIDSPPLWDQRVRGQGILGAALVEL